jgi:hypothetical protein
VGLAERLAQVALFSDERREVAQFRGASEQLAHDVLQGGLGLEHLGVELDSPVGASRAP